MGPLAPLALWHPRNLCHMVEWFLYLVWSHCLALLHRATHKHQGPRERQRTDNKEEGRAGRPSSGARVTGIVTGAASGIGYAMAKQLAGHSRRRYHVVLLVRTEASARDTLRRLKAEAGGGISAEAFAVDLSDPGSVAAFTAAFMAAQATRPPLRLLVNNAGIYASRVSYTAAPFGLEQTFASNLFGHWLLEEELSRLLMGEEGPGRAGGARGCVVSVTSFSHRAVSRGLFERWLHTVQKKGGTSDSSDSVRGTLHPAHAYACSKLAMVLLSHHYHRSGRDGSVGTEGLRWSGVSHICVDPGAVKTKITRRWPRLLAAVYGAAMAGTRLFNRAEDVASSVLRLIHEEEEEEEGDGRGGKWGQSGGCRYLFGEHGVPLNPSPLSKDKALAEQLVARLKELRKKFGV
mmetsp:Transcript_13623/g.34218  ORF Transcript_13623/g.34218 Transcript_13623/m.34218 type:complete len:405 (+) Transcript_13623:191-1405(+)